MPIKPENRRKLYPIEPRVDRSNPWREIGEDGKVPGR